MNTLAGDKLLNELNAVSAQLTLAEGRQNDAQDYGRGRRVLGVDSTKCTHG